MPAGDFYYSKPRFLGSKVGMVEAHAIIYAVVIYKSTAAAIKIFYATYNTLTAIMRWQSDLMIFDLACMYVGSMYLPSWAFRVDCDLPFALLSRTCSSAKDE